MGKSTLSLAVLVVLAALGGCGDKTENPSGTSTTASSSETCKLVSTKDNSPLAIKVVDTDTPEAKEFLATCVNPYTKKYATDAEAAKAGRKVMTYNGCTGCHGGNLGGLMAPSLVKNGGTGAFDTKWVYEKNATDKGMFETIAGGTPGLSGGTMFVWHNQLPGKTGEGLPTDDILKSIAYIRTVYQGDGEKTWLK
ncbi:MAG: c-type cytochrome [Methylotenera sp.]|uniref:c-type cytochrome n=1 Tax=Methylotenera sp. TaxID=2051956 RepID=UPI0024880ED9|nr:c-type cytochrome [Methylotenera sp.]MDI1309642.1 c-type cytochrome [Methylotenera sp.]